MNFAIVGAGAVGSYSGACLGEAGHDATFYMRGEHYQASKRVRCLTVTSVDGDIRIPAEQLHTANEISVPWIGWLSLSVER
jgi:ketopantoate reductase